MEKRVHSAKVKSERKKDESGESAKHQISTYKLQTERETTFIDTDCRTESDAKNKILKI